ncbi:site-specific integrase [Alkalibacter sp. M17DMB]|nr:site-specific integrase [Alkalibacter mobilis]
MNSVEPIRDMVKIEEISNYLRSMDDGERNYILFKIGINNARRISDLLKMRVSDVKNKTHFVYKEQKTGKMIRLFIHPKLKLEIEEYIKDMNETDYLFKSRQSHNLPITRQRVWQILNECKDAANLKNLKVGAHTMRKTFGYHFYQQSKDVVTLMRLFNHTNQQVTLRYIGIIQDDLDNALKKFYL